MKDHILVDGKDNVSYIIKINLDYVNHIFKGNKKDDIIKVIINVKVGNMIFKVVKVLDSILDIKEIKVDKVDLYKVLNSLDN